MNNQNNNDFNRFLQSLPNISWVAIIFGFAFGTIPGLVLLALKIAKEAHPEPHTWEHYEQRMRERTSETTTRTTTTTTTRTTTTSNGASYSSDLKRTSSSARRGRTAASKTNKYGLRQFPYKPIKGGKGLMITGAILAATFALAGFSTLADWSFDPTYLKYMLEDLIPITFFFGGGLGAFFWGMFKNRRAKKFKKYLARIEHEPLIPLRPLAESIPASMDEVCETIQQMIDAGVFGERAYIDIGNEMLVIDASIAKPKPVERQTPVQEKKVEMTSEDQILKEIRDANDRIPGEEISRKIDRIEEITRHILTYLKKHPERSSELHTFLDYYLPTTLKMLNTYAELDAQQSDGENIAATKRRIEGILDKVVEGFEVQLDKLFEGDMLDITSDIDVMEKMLQRDGLSGATRLRDRTTEAKAQQGYTPTLTLDPNQGGSATATMPEEQ